MRPDVRCFWIRIGGRSKALRIGLDPERVALKFPMVSRSNSRYWAGVYVEGRDGEETAGLFASCLLRR
jgi:hypothetical protein